MVGYDGFGRQEGWVEVDGERFALAARPISAHVTTTGASATASAGRRYTADAHPHSGEWVEFEDFGLWGDHVLYNIGDGAAQRDPGEARPPHALRAETHLLQSGEVDLVFADGSVKTMTFERLGNQIAFLRCGMYGGPNGGTPDGDIWHGMKVAEGDEVVVHGETFDVTDPEVRSRLPALTSTTAASRVTARDLRHHRALRHALLRRLQGRGDGLLAPRSAVLSDRRSGHFVPPG